MTDATGTTDTLLDCFDYTEADLRARAYPSRHARHRAEDPYRSLWAVSQLAGPLFLLVCVFGAGLVIGCVIGSLILACSP